MSRYRQLSVKTTLLKLTCFGYPSVWKDGKQITGFISEKALALLLFIAITNETHSRDYLTGLLWGNTAEQKAKSSLRTALYNIGKLLPNVLQVTRKTVTLSAAIETDVSQLSIDRNPAVHVANFLAGFFIADAPEFENWQLRQREQLRLLAIEAWHVQAIKHEQTGNPAEALSAWATLIALEPWREEAHRRRMRLLARSGNFEAALHQFKACSIALRQELAIEPATETIKLADQIHWARSQPRSNLPQRLSPLFGREEALGQLSTALHNNQLVTLVGMGGIGKTALAVNLASHKQNRFLNGVAFVSLANVVPNIDQKESVATAIAHTLTTAGMLPVSRDPAEKHLFSQLAHREMLLILDNFEHLLVEVAFLEKLMHAAPQVSLLITSREQLKLKQEQVIWLDGLNLQSAEKLFSTTAQRIVPTFEPDEAVTKICQLVSGMPLAIELAAGSVDIQTPAEISAQLTNSLTLLQDETVNRTDRHRSIHHLFEQTWQRLTPSSQSLMCGLTLFQTSFSAHAAQEIVNAAPKVLRLLVNQSLIQRDGATRFRLHPLMRQFLQEKGGSADAIGRFSSYFLMQFAEMGHKAEQGIDPKTTTSLTPDHENFAHAWRWSAKNRPAQLEEMAELFHILFADRGLDEWVNKLVQFALQQLPDTPQHARLALRLQLENGYYLFWQAKAFDETYSLLKRSLTQLESLAADSDYRSELAYAHTLLGWYFHFHLTDLDQAHTHFQQAYELYEKLSNLNYQANRLIDLGNIAFERRQWEDAERHWQGCALRAKQVGNELAEACAQFSLGRLAIQQEKWELAAVKLKLSEPALAHHQGLSVEWHSTMGVLAALRQEYGTAHKMFLQQLEICQQYGRVDHTVWAYCNLARIARLENNLEQSHSYFFLAEQLAKEADMSALQTQIETAKQNVSFGGNEV